MTFSVTRMGRVWPQAATGSVETRCSGVQPIFRARSSISQPSATNSPVSCLNFFSESERISLIAGFCGDITCSHDGKYSFGYTLRP